MMRHKALNVLVFLVAAVPLPGMADAAHEASALAWMDGHPSTLAISILQNDETLVLTLHRESEADVRCDVLEGFLVAYIVDGRNQTIRVGCWHMADPGVKVDWSDGEVDEIDMAAFIVNPKLD
jgi:hypothetical protein